MKNPRLKRREPGSRVPANFVLVDNSARLSATSRCLFSVRGPCVAKVRFAVCPVAMCSRLEPFATARFCPVATCRDFRAYPSCPEGAIPGKDSATSSSVEVFRERGGFKWAFRRSFRKPVIELLCRATLEAVHLRQTLERLCLGRPSRLVWCGHFRLAFVVSPRTRRRCATPTVVRRIRVTYRIQDSIQWTSLSLWPAPAVRDRGCHSQCCFLTFRLPQASSEFSASRAISQHSGW